MKSKLSRYPLVYSQILLSLPGDGTPVEIPCRDGASAQDQRLKYYNFLKFLRRNPSEALHFQGRENRITLSIQGHVLRFQLIPEGNQPTGLEEGFQAAVQALNLPSPSFTTTNIVPDLSSGISFTLPEEEPSPAASDPFSFLSQSIDEGGKG